MTKYARPVARQDNTISMVDVFDTATFQPRPDWGKTDDALLDHIFANHKAEWTAAGQWFVQVDDSVVPSATYAGGGFDKPGNFTPPEVVVPAKHVARPVSLSQIAFITLCQLAGGMTDAMLVACKADPLFTAMWIKFDAAPVIDATDVRIQQGLAALAAANYLPNGVAIVLADWPTA